MSPSTTPTSGGSLTKRYRAVSPQELSDISQFGGLRPGPPSFQGKWFGETAADAAEWGRRLFGGVGPLFVIEIVLPTSTAGQLFRLPNLDRIGPARSAEVDQLPLLNATNLGISEVPVIGPGHP